MMTPNEEYDHVLLSEAQVREIIERAASMPSRRDKITWSELRIIACELDIDEQSLEKAFIDVIAETGQQDIPRARWGVASRRLVRGAIAGAALGVGSGFLGLGIRQVVGGVVVTMQSNAYIDVPVTLALVGLSALALRWHKTRGSLGGFLSNVAVLWGTFFAGWSLVSGGPTVDLVATVASGLIGSTAIGSLLLRRRPPSQMPEVAQEMESRGGKQQEHSDASDGFTWRGVVSPTWLRLTVLDRASSPAT